MSFPVDLSSLSAREAAVDALYRCVIGLDTRDRALFESAWTEDSVLDLNGVALEGLQAIVKDCYDPIARLDTLHSLSNIRVNLSGNETKAYITANIVAQHYRPGEGMVAEARGYSTGGFYFVDCVKTDKDGLWKVKLWKLQFTWTEGDKTVMDR